MDVDKVKKIPLPAGERGSFLYTKDMANQYGLELIEDLIIARSVELGVNLYLEVSEERLGFRVSWRPA